MPRLSKTSSSKPRRTKIKVKTRRDAEEANAQSAISKKELKDEMDQHHGGVELVLGEEPSLVGGRGDLEEEASASSPSAGEEEQGGGSENSDGFINAVPDKEKLLEVPELNKLLADAQEFEDFMCFEDEELQKAAYSAYAHVVETFNSLQDSQSRGSFGMCFTLLGKWFEETGGGLFTPTRPRSPEERPPWENDSDYYDLSYDGSDEEDCLSVDVYDDDENIVMAAFRGDVDTLRKLLDEGHSPNAKSTMNTSPPLLSCIAIGSPKDSNRFKAGFSDDDEFRKKVEKRISCAELLIHAGANVTEPDDHGNSPLVKNAMFGMTGVVRLLCMHGAAEHQRAPHGLWMACTCLDGGIEVLDEPGHRRHDMIRTMLEYGLDPNYFDGAYDDITVLGDEGFVILNKGELISSFHLLASSDGDLCDLVRLFLEQHGAKPDLRDGHGNTVLHHAMARYNFKVVRYLLTVDGIDPDARNHDGLTALDTLLEAAWTEHLRQGENSGSDSDSVHSISDDGEDDEDDDEIEEDAAEDEGVCGKKDKALKVSQRFVDIWSACMNEDCGLVRKLLDAELVAAKTSEDIRKRKKEEIHPNVGDSEKGISRIDSESFVTPSHLNSIVMSRIINTTKDSPTGNGYLSTSDRSWFSKFNAGEQADYNLVVALIKKTFLIPDGWDEKKITEVLSMLLDFGVNKDTSTWGLTPLVFACMHGRPHIAKLFADRGARIDLMTLHTTCRSAHKAKDMSSYLAILSSLLENKENLTAMVEPGSNETCIFPAAKYGLVKFMELFVSKGADLEVRNSLGETALICNCKNHVDLDMVSFLLHQCDVKDLKMRRLPIHWASRNNAPTIVIETLLSASKSSFECLSCEDVTGETVMHSLALSPLYAKLLNDLVEVQPDLTLLKDSYGRTVLDVACSESRVAMQQALYFLGRYEIFEGPPAHISRTCIVVFALDHHHDSTNDSSAPPIPVALKLMRDHGQFGREIESRRDLDRHHVVHIIDSYDGSSSLTDNSQDLTSSSAFAKGLSRLRLNEYLLNPTRTSVSHAENGSSLNYDDDGDGEKSPADDTTHIAQSTSTLEAHIGLFKYCVVLPRGDSSLHDSLTHDHFAGSDMTKICEIATQITQALGHIHSSGIIHGDLKPLNLMRCGGRYKLIDFDCSCQIQFPFGSKKPSSGYCPPEMACVLLDIVNETRGRKLQDYIAQISYDMWSLGVVLFELYTGRPLWLTDLNDDISLGDLEALASWNDVKLEEALYSASVSDSANFESSEQAQNLADLIRWLLRASVFERPASIEEVLEHRFFQNSTDKGTFGVFANGKAIVSPGCFISHYQEHGGGTTARWLVGLLKEQRHWLQRHVWYDMDRTELSAKDMQEGVRSHKHFVLLLTSGYFKRWFCKLELTTAFKCGANIILVHETDPEHGGFASFGDYQNELNEQKKSGGNYADADYQSPELAEKLDALFNINSIPLYHDPLLARVSVQKILYSMGLFSNLGNDVQLRSLVQSIPHGARINVVAPPEGQGDDGLAHHRTQIHALADELRSIARRYTNDEDVLEPYTVTEMPADTAAHTDLSVILTTRPVLSRVSSIVLGSLKNCKSFVILCQMDKRSGYEGVMRHELAHELSDSGIDASDIIPFIAPIDFRQEAICAILDKLKSVAEVRHVSIHERRRAIALRKKNPTEELELIVKSQQEEIDRLSKRVTTEMLRRLALRSRLQAATLAHPSEQPARMGELTLRRVKSMGAGRRASNESS